MKRSAAFTNFTARATQLGLVIAPGPHDETPELQLAVMRWFNRYLKGEETPVETAAKRFFSPAGTQGV